MLRLTELALKNGWPVKDIARALQAIVAPSVEPVDRPAPASPNEAGSRIEPDDVSRLAFARR